MFVKLGGTVEDGGICRMFHTLRGLGVGVDPTLHVGLQICRPLRGLAWLGPKRTRKVKKGDEPITETNTVVRRCRGGWVVSRPARCVNVDLYCASISIAVYIWIIDERRATAKITAAG